MSNDSTKQPTFDISQLPTSFKKFLDVNDIDPAIYTMATQLPRYVRTNTHLPIDQRPTCQELKEQLGTEQVFSVPGLQDFFSIMELSNTRISDIPAYKQHAIFGIDLSSAIAVLALELNPDDQVLDLCCAPGAKLCMISNILGRQGLGTATGVDVAAHRLATCRSLLKKYKVGEKIRLFEADGTTFSVPPPSRLGNRVIYPSKATAATVKPFWASRMLRHQVEHSTALYDKVLVDAECTHDGSIAHILKYEKWGWDLFESKFMDPTRLVTISKLQCDLMRQGWHMLKQGGTMVYSTCSLSIRQNEENVAWFLTQFPNARLVKIPCTTHIKPATIKQQHINDKLQSTLENFCLRFDPIQSRTSGFFVARFNKMN